MIYRISLCSASLLLLILAAPLVAQAQTRCPVISIKGPAESKLGKTITYEAELKDYGGRGEFKWSVVGGTIVEGQGSKKIKVAPTSHRVQVEVKFDMPPRDNPLPRCDVRAATKTKIDGAPNMLPIISAVSSAQITVSLPCPDGTMPAMCAASSSQAIELRLDAQDPDGDTPLFDWNVTGGRITGQNPGIWNLSNQQPGTYTASVSVRDDEGGTSNTITFTATVDACAGCGGVDPQTAVIFGVVKDVSGRPISGATVTLTGNTSRETTTGSDGNYQFTNLALGPYRVNARRGALRGTDTTNLLGATDQAEVNIVIR